MVLQKHGTSPGLVTSQLLQRSNSVSSVSHGSTGPTTVGQHLLKAVSVCCLVFVSVCPSVCLCPSVCSIHLSVCLWAHLCCLLMYVKSLDMELKHCNRPIRHKNSVTWSICKTCELNYPMYWFFAIFIIKYAILKFSGRKNQKNKMDNYKIIVTL